MTMHPGRTARIVAVALLTAAVAAGSAAAEAFRFVSIPDWLNADLGDISVLPTYDGGGNSTTPSYEAAMDFVLDAVAAENPEFVLVVGDTVNGHWNQDVDNRQIFGPTGTRVQKADAINAAADFYYTEWKQRFDDRGLAVHVAVGDHEVGDNNWAAGTDKAHLVPTFKDAFTRNFMVDAGGNYVYAERPVGTPYEGTAYAFQHENTLFVTVDVFRQDDPDTSIDTKTGSVKADVNAGQLAWLDGVLAGAAADPTVEHVIVQGHTPVLAPVRYQNSSNLTMPGHENTDFWQTMETYGVDLYFCGEVHDMTASNYGGVEQVAHGGILGYADDINYLVATVDGPRIDLELMGIDCTVSGDKMWQCGSNRPRQTIAFDDPAFATVGTLTIDKASGDTVYTNRTGYFTWYGTFPAPEPGLVVHLAMDEAAGSATIQNTGTSGATNDGALEGPEFVTGKFGNALVFDAGENDRVLCGATPVTGGTPRTTSAWVKTTAGTTESNGITLFTFGDNTNGGKWDVDLDNGKLEVGIGGGRSIGGPVTANDGVWHLVTAVLTTESGTIDDVLFYIDGQLVADATTSDRVTDTDATGRFVLGHAQNADFFQAFTGTLDDVAIWTEALSPAAVLALFQLGDTDDLAYDAGAANRLFEAYAEGLNVMVDGTPWYYAADGLTGGLGEVVDLGGGDFAVRLASGAGMTTVPEPATLLLLLAGAGMLLRRRR